MLELVKTSGPAGILILLSSAALMVYSVYALFTGRERASYWLLLGLALVPLTLGVAGAAAGPGASPAANEVAGGRRHANAPLLLGGGAFVAFALIAGLGLLTQRESGESPV